MGRGDANRFSGFPVDTARCGRVRYRVIVLKLPIPNKAQKDFLNGKGHLTFETSQDVWNGAVSQNARFTEDMDAIADVGVELDGGNQSFGFGRNGGLSLTVSGTAGFSHQVQLLWAGKESDQAAAKQMGLRIPEHHVYARVALRGQAEGAAAAKFPAGPLSAKVGIGAGGHASYERWLLRHEDTGARDFLTDLFGGLRLPQSIDEAAELPEDGEVLVLGYGGYLKLNAGVSWGYSIQGTKSLHVPQMPLDLHYQFRAMAAVDFGYRLAGEYQLEVRKAEADWARFTVRKSRESETTLAADFGVTAAYSLKGLPDSADEFLSKLFGAHADRIVELFEQGRTYSDLGELEKAAGKLLKGAVHDYSQQVLGVALSDATVQEVLGRMRQVAAAYAHLDQRLIGLYHDVLKQRVPGEIEGAIDLVLGAGTKEQLAGLSGDQRFGAAIDLLRRLYNEKLFAILQKDEAFAEAIGLLRQAKALLNGVTEADAQIRKWIAAVQGLVPVDGLLKQLAGMDEKALAKLADERLQGAVEKLLGKGWEALNGSDFKRAADLVHKQFDKIAEFKDKWYREAVEKVTKQSFAMDLHLAYSRARKNEKLLEVEVNLAHADGPRLARAAAAGDFEELLQCYDTRVARIRQGMFSTEMRNSMRVKFNVLGYSSGLVQTLFQKSSEALETREGGLMHVHTSETFARRERETGWKFKERLDSKFLVQAIGESLQREGEAARPYAVEVLRSMTSSFALFQSDEQTRPEELAEYLRLANELGLLDQEAGQYARELAAACGGQLGKVTLTYRVGFDTAGLRSAFRFVGDMKDPDGGQLGREAREAMRGFLWRKFAAGAKSTNWFARVAFAYRAEIFYQLYRRHELNAEPRGVTLPPWFTGFSRPEQANLRANPELLQLERLYLYEDKMVKGLLAVDAQVDLLEQLPPGGTIDWTKLNEAILKLVDAAGAVAEYDASCFPVILDRLIQRSSGGTAKRDSTVLLEVEAPGMEKVTRILASGPKNGEEVAADD